MKKISIYILSLAFFIQACDFESYQDDPNRTTEASPSLILTDLSVDSFNTLGAGASLASRMMVYLDARSDEQYYSWNRAGYGAYDQLRQTVKMIEEAERASLPNYAALAKFFQAWHFYQLTMTFGDIPFSDALGGFDGNYQPTYDTQEEVIAGILSLLDEANTELAAGSDQPDLLGDVIFGGDAMKWRKAINSFRLRVLMTLSNQDGSSTIDVSGIFDDMVTAPSTYPLMESNDDNLALPHYDIAGSRYPFFNDQNLIAAYQMETTFIEMLKDRSDPRLFMMATINANSSDPDDFDSYGGLDGSADFTSLGAEAATGVGSFPALRYSQDPDVEPSVAMGYSELQFILAEAVELGWTAGDAEVHYNAGITANMEFYGIDGSDISSYLSEPLVDYNSGTGIEQINTQKYLTYFFSSGWESFYNQRRTGFPSFTATDFNEGQVPVRWMYPQNELNLNGDNVQAAITSQFSGDDTINGQMWLVQ